MIRILLGLLLFTQCVYAQSQYVTKLAAGFNNGECEVGVDPEGLFVSVLGSPAAVGSFSDPWDLTSAMDGTQTLALGAVVNILQGVYTNLNSPPIYFVNESDVEYRPYPPQITITSPYPVRIKGGLQIDIQETGVIIRGLHLSNDASIPLSAAEVGNPPGEAEPTRAGSPYPDFPGPEPAGWSDWSAGGTMSVGGSVGSGGNGHRIYNNVTTGGAGGFSTFQAHSIIVEGHIGYGVGWDATDRPHGQIFYWQNPSNNPAEKITGTHTILSHYNKRATAGLDTGRNTYNLFATGVDIQNMDITEGYGKGPFIAQSQNLVAHDLVIRDMLVENVAVPNIVNAGIEPAFAVGRPSSADDTLTFVDNTAVNGRKAVVNGLWTNLTDTGTRQIKTDPIWYITTMDQPPAHAFLEPGVFLDFSGGGGVDEHVVYLMTSDIRRAHAYVSDFDLSGSVTIDTTTFATVGVSIAIYHYRDMDTPVFNGVSAAAISLTIVDGIAEDGAADTTDAFLLIK